MIHLAEAAGFPSFRLAIAMSPGPSWVLVLIVAAATRTAGLLKRSPVAETRLRWGTGTLLFALGARLALSKGP